jgi:hypothetical protein
VTNLMVWTREIGGPAHAADLSVIAAALLSRREPLWTCAGRVLAFAVAASHCSMIFMSVLNVKSDRRIIPG